MRRCCFARRLRTRHRSTNSCKSLSCNGEQPHHHSRPQQDWPSCCATWKVCWRIGKAHWLPTRRLPPSFWKNWSRCWGIAQRNCEANPSTYRKSWCTGSCIDFWLGLRFISRRCYICARSWWPPLHSRSNSNDVYWRSPRDAWSRCDFSWTCSEQGAWSWWSGLSHYRRERCAPISCGRHCDNICATCQGSTFWV